MTASTLKSYSIERWSRRLPELTPRYRTADGYPHVVLEDFLDSGLLDEALAQFPDIAGDGWTNYRHFNQKKHGLEKLDLIPEKLRGVIEHLNSPEFVAWLSALTGIENLLSDPYLAGGGLHQSVRGGFLNVHADFTGHPVNKTWRRRVNVLVYLNRDWPEEYKGHLEIWTRDMGRCVEKILPIFNRCVIFDTDSDTYHGHPQPSECPEGQTRKSIALYYYTEEAEAFARNATSYQATASDTGLRKLFIKVDTGLIKVYSKLRERAGFTAVDRIMSAILNRFGPRGRS